MSTEFHSFEQSLASVDVESVRVPPGDVAAAIDEYAAGPTVGVPLDRSYGSYPNSVRVDPTPADLEKATTGITPAAFAVAEYGSIVLPSTADGSELVSLYVDRHIAVLEEENVVDTMEAAFERFGADIPSAYGDAIIATGPSATADMGALVKGAHGPREVVLIVVEG